MTLDTGLPLRFLTLALLTVLLSVFFIAMQLRKKEIKTLRSGLFIIYGLLVFYFVFRISGKFFIADSFYEWIRISLYFLLLFLVYQLFSFKTIRSGLIWSLSILGIILTLWGLTELVIITKDRLLEIPLTTYEIKAGFGHRNLFAQVLFFTIPFQVYQVLLAKNKKVQLLFLVAGFCAVFLLVVLSNRATWLVLMVTFLIFILYIIILKKHISVNPKFLRKYVTCISMIIVMALVLSFLFFQFFTTAGKVTEHLTGMVNIETGSGKDRTELWKRTIMVFEENPVFGIGLANWKIEMLKYGNEGLVSEDNVTFYQRPHNDYLWMLSEAGIIALLLFMTVVLLAFTKIIGFIKNDKQLDNSFFFLSLLIALSGFLIYSFFSFPHERIIHNTIIVLFLSAILAKSFESNPVYHRNIKSFLWILILLTPLVLSIISFAAGIIRFNGETHLKNALRAKNKKDYNLIIHEIDNAHSFFYQMDPTSTPLTWYKGFAYFRQNKFDESLDIFNNAYKINPYHIHVLNNLASVHAMLKQYEESVNYYQKALIIAPNFEESRFNLCAVYFNMGNPVMAYDVLKQVNIDTKDSRLMPFVKATLKAIISKIISENDNLNNFILPENENWYFDIHKQHLLTKKSIKQLIFDQENKPITQN